MEKKRFFWEIVPGTRCNLRCKTCYAAENARPDNRTLDWKAIEKAQNRVIDMGMTDLEVLGGEPLLYPYLDEFVANFKTRNQEGFCGVVTNGIALTPERSRKLKDAGIDQVTVSLDGTNAEINDKNRGRNSFDKAVKGIENAMKADIGVTLAYTITPFNIDDSKGLFAFAQKLGVEAVGIQITEMVGRAKKTMGKYGWFNRTVGLAAIEKAYSDHRITMFTDVNTRNSFKGMLNRFYNAGLELPDVRCDGGTSTFMISSGGEFIPCSQYAYGPDGETRRTGVNLVLSDQEIISSKIGEYGKFNEEMRSLEERAYSSCLSCQHREVCAPCPLANPAGEVPECKWVENRVNLLDRLVRESRIKALIKPDQISDGISFRVPTQELPISLPMSRTIFDQMMSLGTVKEMEDWTQEDIVPFLCKLRSHKVIEISGMEGLN